MTIVVATGVFELIHPGHILFLKESKKLGDKLVVVVARDVNVEKTKHVVPEEQRLSVVKALRPVDDAILGDESDIFKSLERIKPDIIALGQNQGFDENELQTQLHDRGIDAKIVRIDKFLDGPLHSTNKIIEEIVRISGPSAISTARRSSRIPESP